MKYQKEILQHKKFEDLKNSVSGYINGYSIRALLLTDLLYYSYGRTDISNNSFFEVYQTSKIFYDYSELVEVCKKKEVVLTVLHERKDHYEFMGIIQKQLESAQIFKNFNLKILSVKKWSKNAGRVFKYFFFQVGNDLSLKEKKYFAIKLCIYLNTLSQLESQISSENLKIKKFVAFNGPYGLDAVLTEFFNKMKVSTYSIQHGVCCDFKNFLPYDIINYHFQNTQKILCWGKEAVRVLKSYGVDKDKFIISGNPKYSIEDMRDVKVDFKSCLVLLGRYIYHSGNIELLHLLNKVSKRLNIKFYIKPHPSLIIAPDIDFKDYLDLIGKYKFNLIENDFLLTDLLKSNKYDFTVTYNTSAYFESYFFGLISLRYAFEENESFKGLGDQFDSAESFSARVEEFKAVNVAQLNGEVKVIIEDSLGFSNTKYKQILN